MAMWIQLLAGHLKKTVLPGGQEFVDCPKGFEPVKHQKGPQKTFLIVGDGDWYLGYNPPQHLLDRDDVLIKRADGLPWAKSAQDRLSSYPERDQKPRKDGKPHRGPLAMAVEMADGPKSWLVGELKETDSFVETKLRSPEQSARVLLGRYGLEPKEIERRVRLYLSRTSVGSSKPNLAALILESQDAGDPEIPKVPPRREPQPTA